MTHKFSFDGHGINFVGGYAERVATLSLEVKVSQGRNEIGHLLAASGDLLEALEGIAEDAQEQINDIGMDIQEGGTFNSKTLAKWSAVLSAIEKAKGRI